MLDKVNQKLLSLLLEQHAEEQGNDGLLVNILPSYQMYQLTISKPLTPVDELRSTLPMYELTPQLSATLNDYFGPAATNTDQQEDTDNTFLDDTLLANAHKLKRLTSVNKDLSKSLSIQINLTEEIGQIGVEPKVIDPLSVEVKQGDVIYGFILVSNKTGEDIPFDMFSVVLEGSVAFGESKSSVILPSNVVRFLTMFDFNALWNDACLDRLTTDHFDPNIPINEVDPIDNTIVNFTPDKIISPGLVYKKYFTFRMPEKLLESSCSHGVLSHLQIPSTLGISKNEVITVLREKWKDGTPKLEEPKYASLKNDFAFGDASIDFSISARIIGRASDYKNFSRSLQLNGDEYVVANEAYCHLRVIGATGSMFELNRPLMAHEAKLVSINMTNTIKQKIALGKELLKLNSTLLNSRTNSFEDLTISERPGLFPTQSTTDLAKMEQKYQAKRETSVKDDKYEILHAHKKKSVFASKMLGLIAFATPKKEYKIDYVPQFVQDESRVSNVTIPFEISFVSYEKSGTILPDFKKVSLELVALTVKSNLPIPLEIHPEMLFENKARGLNTFDAVTVKQFQRQAIEIQKLIKTVGNEALDVDRETLRCIKCMANLDTKYDHLKLPNLDILQTSWQLDNNESLEIRHFKKFDLKIDLNKAVSSTPGEFCLIPSFQSCLLARLYYVIVNLKSPNGEKITLRVPLVIERRK